MEPTIVEKKQILSVEYRDGESQIYDDIIGYQVGGGCLAITFKNFSVSIHPLDTVKSVLAYNKE